MIYKKKNGDILQRTVFNSPYKIGDINAFGWKVIDIKYSYNNKFYSNDEYNKLIKKSWDRDRKIMLLKKKLHSIYKNISDIVILIFLIRVFELASKINV